MARNEDNRHWRVKYRPYLVAVACALVMTMLIAPKVNSGDAMNPTLKNGQVVVMKKETFSAKRGSPELGSVIVLDKGLIEELGNVNAIRRVAGLPGETIDVDGTAVKLADDEIFVMGDNRGVSIDSRDENVGPVKLANIRGTVIFVVWPLSDIGGIE